MVGKGAKLYKGDNEYDIDSFEGALDILMSVAQKACPSNDTKAWAR